MQKLGIVILAFVFLCASAAGVWRLLTSDAVVILFDDGPASWIRADEPFDVASKQNISTATIFMAPIQIPRSGDNPVLQVMALRRVVVEMDGVQIFDSGPNMSHWKAVHLVPIPRSIRVGSHELRCVVTNADGPSLMRLKCAGLAIDSNPNWFASVDGKTFRCAVPASRIWEPAVSDHYLPSRRGMVALAPFVALFFAVGMFARSRRWKSSAVIWPARFRWLLLGAWLLLSWNNLFKVPRFSGYDLDGHYEFISYVFSHGSLPRPDLGWQTFQSPLYYILSAVFSRLLIILGASDAPMPFLLRIIPLACGAAMVEIGFRAGRLVFPNRSDLQLITIAFTSLVPVNIYMAQTVSNEPMAAVMSGLLLLIILKLLTHPPTAVSARWIALAGLAFGAAFLTKINALLWAIPLMVATGFALHQIRAKWTQWISTGAIMAAAVFASCGWLIIRNIRLIGKPFFLQSSVSGLRWWQDPGYRVPANFYEFGHLFHRPFYNVFGSVWDSVYATLWGTGIPNGPVPWNLGLMEFGLWLGLIPSALIMAGIFRVIAQRSTKTTRACLGVSLLSVVCFAAAILYVYVTLPVYSCGKASYMLSTMPCLGLLAAYGFDWLPKTRPWRAIACGGFVCWGMTAYFTYFVIL